ncbi:hypothetical protein NC99_44830 [Sunxiuqinia dokdonensis]|uniref:Uncharacterized protein n=1 Tax=Sunxiuqinia dokdonensis TaxID=1409788 RepID=A0A0L8V2X3_9BACT|nr:hypothetical protein NC99_44830 [Sunxiuqinia dokdonensis]
MQFKLQSGPDGLIKTEFSGLNFFAMFLLLCYSKTQTY